MVIQGAVRLGKGAFMALMFALFLLGMLFFTCLVLPVSRLVSPFSGRESRLQVERAVRTGFSWWLKLLALAGLLRSRPSRGRPAEGPCIVVCNHPGLFDVLYLIRDIPNLSVMVKPSLPRSLPLGPLLRALGYVVATDHAGTNPLDSAEEAISRIRQGSRLQVFPEGTRSPVGGLRTFRPGAFKVARITGVPVQPVLIRNTPPFLPKGAKWYFPPAETSVLELEFWEPLSPPAKGEEREFAQSLEGRYRSELGIRRS